jgi:hypothetical protein
MAKKFEVKTKLTVDDKLSPGLRRAQRIAKRTMSSISSASKRAAGSIARIGVVGAAAAAAGITKLTLDWAKAGDELAKMSKQTGVGVIALQELDFAARHAGLSSEWTKKAIEGLAERIGDARAGTGTLVTILRKASPALLEEIKATNSASEAFDIMIGSLEKIENSHDRAALAKAAFGRVGKRVIRITEGGVEAFRKLRKEAHKYNLITPQQTKHAEAFTDQLQDTGEAAGSVARGIGADLVPVMTPYLKKLEEWLLANDKLIAQNVSENVAKLASAIEGADWDAIAESIGEVSSAVLWLSKNLSVSLVGAFTATQAALAGHPLIATLLTVGTAVSMINDSLNDVTPAREVIKSGSIRQKAVEAFSGGAIASFDRPEISPANFRTIGEAQAASLRHQDTIASIRRQQQVAGFQPPGQSESRVVLEIQGDTSAVRVKSVKGDVPTSVETGHRFGGM